jgi:hypothetical protein
MMDVNINNEDSLNLMSNLGMAGGDGYIVK